MSAVFKVHKIILDLPAFQSLRGKNISDPISFEKEDVFLQV